ncbi:hypothetical protein KQJ29_35700, partial [Enterococcus sp. S181_ASV_20]|nr:hypothetical protein [Enterococcus sp. S181_ASV_20]
EIYTPTSSAASDVYKRQAAGRIFSYNQSFQAAGNVVGPMIGSSVSSIFGYRGVFISTSALVLTNYLLVHRLSLIHI